MEILDMQILAPSEIEKKISVRIEHSAFPLASQREQVPVVAERSEGQRTLMIFPGHEMDRGWFLVDLRVDVSPKGRVKISGHIGDRLATAVTQRLGRDITVGATEERK